MRLHYVRTLVYYDGPQVFEARDSIGGHYIAVLGAGEQTRYLVAGVAPGHLRMFCDGESDLRQLVAESDADCRYMSETVPSAEGEELAFESFLGPLDGFLPDHGFVLDDLPSADLVAGGNLRLELKLDPGRMATGGYTDLIHNVQVLARHTISTLREASESWRLNDGMLDVVTPAAAGSFRILLEASGRQGPKFRSKLAQALRLIDSLFQHSEDPEKALAAVMEYPVEVAATYLKLLRILDKNETGLRYSWAGREIQGVRRGAVSRREARALAALAATLYRRRSARQTFVRDGELYRCNTGTGFWGLWTDTGRVLGRVRGDGPDLSGLRVGGQYRFFCEAEYDLRSVRGAVYLLRHELADVE